MCLISAFNCHTHAVKAVHEDDSNSEKECLEGQTELSQFYLSLAHTNWLL